jgi:predicted ATPase
VVLTGGPGAGKTATLEFARRSFCRGIAILPEAASILFGGGFWRSSTTAGRKAAQRAIFHVQDEQERLLIEEERFAFALCDRGTVDGLAYWPEPEASFWRELHTSREAMLGRYYAVIHLRTPAAGHGYNHDNPLRTEDAGTAHEIDERILGAWQGHPNLHVIDSAEDFMTKVQTVMKLIQSFLPDCCQKHPLPIATPSR